MNRDDTANRHASETRAERALQGASPQAFPRLLPMLSATGANGVLCMILVWKKARSVVSNCYVLNLRGEAVWKWRDAMYRPRNGVHLPGYRRQYHHGQFSKPGR